MPCTLLQTYYFLNSYHLLIFRYIKGRTKLTRAISNPKCLFILAPQDKLDLQASRPQIYLLFNNLSTERSSNSFLFPFIKVQVLMKNGWIRSAAQWPHTAASWMEINTLLASRSAVPGQNLVTDAFFICTNNIIPLMIFTRSFQPQVSSQKYVWKSHCLNVFPKRMIEKSKFSQMENQTEVSSLVSWIKILLMCYWWPLCLSKSHHS